MLDQPEQQAGSILHSQRTHQDDAPARTPAPSEVFGPFGPPGWSPGEEIPRSIQSPAQMPDVSEQPTQPPIHHAPLLPDPRPIIFPTLAHGYGYPPIASAPPAPQKKPIYFPLTRRAPALLQIFGMLGYSLLLAISIMVIVLYLLGSYHQGLSIFINVDGSTNGLAILLVAVLALLIVPACSLLSGALFGSWRGLLVSLFSTGGGVLFAHLSNAQFLNNVTSIQPYLALAPLPISALTVGLIYDQRKYASWGKSFSIFLLGSAIICLWLFVLLFIASANSPNLSVAAQTASLTPQSLLASVGVVSGCMTILAIPLMAIPMAAIEGIVHNRITATKR
jgi:hypothetical protein